MVLHISVSEGIGTNSNPPVMLWAPFSKSMPGLIMIHLLHMGFPTEAYCNKLLTEFPASPDAYFLQSKIRSFHSPAQNSPGLSCHVEWKPTFLALTVRPRMACESTNRSQFPTWVYCVTTVHIYQPPCECSCFCSPTFTPVLSSVWDVLPRSVHSSMPSSQDCQSCLLLLPCLHPPFTFQSLGTREPAFTSQMALPNRNDSACV